MDKKIFTLHRSSPSRILLYGIRTHDGKEKEDDEKDNEEEEDEEESKF
jgi:hypothetical protein